jgi:hypothetical protein
MVLANGLSSYAGLVPRQRERIIPVVNKKLRLFATASLSLAAVTLGSCMTATPYQPYIPEASAGVHGGFSEQQLSPDLFLVRFHGNEMTSRERVEGYLLYRAAELTLQKGFDWFHPVASHTEHEIRTYTTTDPFYSPYYGSPYWRPYWRYYDRGGAWTYWDPWVGGPFWYNHVDVRTIEAFEASAQVSMHKGPVLANEPRAMDAREVMARLGPTIQLPKQR